MNNECTLKNAIISISCCFLFSCGEIKSINSVKVETENLVINSKQKVTNRVIEKKKDVTKVKITTLISKSCGVSLSFGKGNCPDLKQSTIASSISYDLVHQSSHKKYSFTSNPEGLSIKDLPKGSYSIVTSKLFSVKPNRIEVTEKSTLFQLTFKAKLR